MESYIRSFLSLNLLLSIMPWKGARVVVCMVLCLVSTLCIAGPQCDDTSSRSKVIHEFLTLREVSVPNPCVVQPSAIFKFMRNC